MLAKRKGYWFGKKHTQEYKDKMSKSLSGKNNPMYGLKVPEERKEKIRRSVLAHYKKNGTDNLKGKRLQTSLSLKGHFVSKRTRKKISILASKRQVGFKNPNWKGGITPLGSRIRGSMFYEKWRNAVFEKDCYTCQDCKKVGGNLEPHHIKRFMDILKDNNIKSFEKAVNCEELWDISNGITYCIECHVKNDKFRNI